MSKNQKNQKDRKKLILLLLLLIVFCVGIGYAILTQQLSINNTVNYGSMKWNIGFDTAENNGGTVVAAPTIAEDKKSMTIACNLGSSTKAETCIVKSTIKNDSTFDIELSANPTVTTNNTYINSVATTWVTTTSNTGDVKQNDIIPAGEEHEIQILISTKELTQDLLPEAGLSIPVTVTMNWVEKN